MDNDAVPREGIAGTLIGRARRPLELAGAGFTIAALGFVGWQVFTTGLLGADAWREPSLWQRVAAVSLAYGASLLLLAAAWKRLLASATRVRLTVADSVHVYAVSQIYKYVPSNIFQFVGRHVMLRARGVEHGAALWSAAAESILLLVAALAVATVFGLVGVEAAAGAPTIAGWILPLLLAGGGAAWLVFARVKQSGYLGWLSPDLDLADVRSAAVAAFGLHFLFFVAAGFAFAFICGYEAGWSMSDAPALVTLWSAAWLLGYVTPGASAGIGVREALLIGGMTIIGGAENVALIAVASRISTIGGELLFAAVGLCVRPAFSQVSLAGLTGGQPPQPKTHTPPHPHKAK